MTGSRFVNWRQIILFTALIVLLLAVYYFGFFAVLENKVYDLWTVIEYNFYFREIRDPVIVSVDEKTLDYFSDWPLSRNVYAEVIEILMQNGVAGVGLDITFSEEREAAGDRALLRTLRDYDNLVLPVTAEMSLVQKPGGRKIIEAEDFVLPVEEMAAAARLGHINLVYDRDGVVRTRPPSFSSYASFSREMAALAESGIKEKRDKGSWNEYRIKFYGPEGTIPRLSLLDVLEGRFEEDYFADKLVFIGVTAPDILGDTYITPLSQYGQMSGVEIHAVNTLNYLEDSFKYIPFYENFFLLGVVMLLVAAGFYLLSPRWAGIGVGVFAVLYTVTSLYVFISYDIYLCTAAVLLAIFILSGAGIIYWYLAGEKEKQRLVDSFSGYVSDRVLENILEAPERVKPGGELREVSVFFLDIRGFTAYSEDKRPQEVVDVLNDLFSRVSGFIMEAGGTVDKYLGDGIMAYFGAPVDMSDHRQIAVRTACRIQEFICGTDCDFDVGIGINTGEVLAGNVGSSERMDYTVIGSAVNRAARFVELAGPGEIVVGEDVFLSLPSSEKARWQETTEEIRGSGKKMLVYRLIYGRENNAK